jgi:formamidopyrimidine-DNA glycosylase
MPELPDVENVVKRIRPYIAGKVLKDLKILDSLLLQLPAATFKENLIGKKVYSIKRRGKFILVYLKENLTLVLHLRMTGNLLWLSSFKEKHPHDRIIFFFEHGKLHFRDQRRLGKIYLVPDEDFSSIKTLFNMGPEPLSEEFTLEVFNQLFKKKKGKIKSILLDQSFVAGIGNIYGDEILFQSGIRPTRRAQSLQEKEVKTLFEKVKKVLSEAVSDYERLSQKNSWFINWRRRGICPRRCGKLERVKIGGRYSYFCPICQK